MDVTLEELTALAMDTVRDAVGRVMEADRCCEEANMLLRSARDVAAQLLHATDENELARELETASEQLLGSLRGQDGAGSRALTAPSHDEIELQVRHAATVMMSSWSEFLRRALRSSDETTLELERCFLLPRRVDVAERLWKRFFQTLEPLGFDTDDAGSVMRAVSGSIFDRAKAVRLPGGVELNLRPDGVVVAHLGS